MSEQSFTPERKWEWALQDGEYTALVWRHPEGGGGYIISPEATCDNERAHVVVTLNISDKNASMIAAAPAMFEALKAILSHANRAEITAKEWSAGLAALRLATEPTNER